MLRHGTSNRCSEHTSKHKTMKRITRVLIFIYYKIRMDVTVIYRGANKSLARPTSRRVLFDGENISFDASLVIYM